jgi:hypothetical protein
MSQQSASSVAITGGNITGTTTTAFSAGTKSSGTYTPAFTDGNLQYATNGGAHTLAAPSADGSMVIYYLNNGSAGNITFSGFTYTEGYAVSSGVFSELTNTNKYMFYITRINSISRLNVVPLQ